MSRPPLSAVETSGVISGSGDQELAGVLILDQVSVLQLAEGQKEECADLCRGDCVRWDWRQADRSCILDHRQDLRGIMMEEDSAKKTDRRAKPKRKSSRPPRRTTKRPARVQPTEGHQK